MIEKIKTFLGKYLLLIEVVAAVILTAGMMHAFGFTFSQRFVLVLLMFIAFFVLVRKGISCFSVRRFKYSLWFAMPMGLAFWFGQKVTLQSIDIKQLELFDFPFIIILITIFCLISISIFDFMDRKGFVPKGKEYSNKKSWLVPSLIIFLCWMPLFLSFFPGLVSVDSAVQIRQAIGESVMSNWHPVLHTLFIGLPANIGLMVFGDLTAGIAMATLLQMIIMALVFGYTVRWALMKTQKRWVGCAFLAFFAFCPVVAIYAITLWKDILFSAMFMLLVINLYDLITTIRRDERIGWYNLLVLLVLAILVAFLRNGGVLIIVGLGIALLIYYKKMRIIMAVGFLVALIFVVVIQGPVYKALGVASSPFMESMSIPAQQMGYLAYTGKLSEDEKEELSKYADVDRLAEKYEPMNADPAKNSFDYSLAEEDKAGFLGLWMKLLTGHFVEYVKAYLLQINSYWYIQGHSWSLDINHVHDDVWLVTDYTDAALLGEGIHDILYKVEKGLVESSWLGWIGNVGVMFWGIALMLVIFMYQKKYYMLVPMTCIIVYMLSLLIASPVSSMFRYVYSLLLMMPVLLVVCFVKNKKGVKK